MVAIPVVRTPIELNARTLATTALFNAGVDRTEEAVAYVAECLMEQAEMSAAVWAMATKTADDGDAITKAKLLHSPPGD